MLRSMKVKDCMTKHVLTLSSEMEILHAAHKLLKSGFSGAPVLDRHGQLVGVLTERDFMAVATHAFYHGEPGGQVKKYMSPKPESVGPEESVLTLAERFIKGRFHRYPVVDNGRLVGVVSRRDVMRALAEFYPV